MKRILYFLAITAMAVATPAHAGFIFSADFTGVVDQTQGATGFSPGDTVTGHFDIDSGTGKFLDFKIGGKSVEPNFDSTATFSPGNFDAFYTAAVSPVAQNTPSNSSFTLDLSSLTSWPAFDNVYTLLIDKNQLATNLDTASNPKSNGFPSTFSYYTANANGSSVVSLGANLTSITATAPEPGTLAVAASALLGLGLMARRRRA